MSIRAAELRAKETFSWIVGILQTQGIPFHVAGGLAARVYGAQRELADIDFDIPEEAFERLVPSVKNYITYGPEQYRDESWDLLIMTLNYKRQEIDIAGAYKAKLFNRDKQVWESARANFSKDQLHTIFNLLVPVMDKEELVAYKSKLQRAVDIQDIEEIRQAHSAKLP